MYGFVCIYITNFYSGYFTLYQIDTRENRFIYSNNYWSEIRGSKHNLKKKQGGTYMEKTLKLRNIGERGHAIFFYWINEF